MYYKKISYNEIRRGLKQFGKPANGKKAVVLQRLRRVVERMPYFDGLYKVGGHDKLWYLRRLYGERALSFFYNRTPMPMLPLGSIQEYNCGGLQHYLRRLKLSCQGSKRVLYDRLRATLA